MKSETFYFSISAEEGLNQLSQLPCIFSFILRVYSCRNCYRPRECDMSRDCVHAFIEHVRSILNCLIAVTGVDWRWRRRLIGKWRSGLHSFHRDGRLPSTILSQDQLPPPPSNSRCPPLAGVRQLRAGVCGLFPANSLASSLPSSPCPFEPSAPRSCPTFPFLANPPRPATDAGRAAAPPRRRLRRRMTTRRRPPAGGAARVGRRGTGRPPRSS